MTRIKSTATIAKGRHPDNIVDDVYDVDDVDDDGDVVDSILPSISSNAFRFETIEILFANGISFAEARNGIIKKISASEEEGGRRNCSSSSNGSNGSNGRKSKTRIN